MVLALPLGTAAQSDFELAEFYYNEGSYEQAKLYLEQLWKKNKTKKVYDMYYASLLRSMILNAPKNSSRVACATKTRVLRLTLNWGSFRSTYACNSC